MKKEHSISEPKHNHKQYNVYVFRVLEERRTEKRFEEIMAEIFSSLTKTTTQESKKTLQTPSTRNMKKKKCYSIT